MPHPTIMPGAKGGNGSVSGKNDGGDTDGGKHRKDAWLHLQNLFRMDIILELLFLYLANISENHFNFQNFQINVLFDNTFQMLVC